MKEVAIEGMKQTVYQLHKICSIDSLPWEISKYSMGIHTRCNGMT